jgi:hypothetical protein
MNASPPISSPLLPSSPFSTLTLELGGCKFREKGLWSRSLKKKDSYEGFWASFSIQTKTILKHVCVLRLQLRALELASMCEKF